MKVKEKFKPTIGFIGAGNMGLPMIKNLIKKGFQLKVYDINPKITKRLDKEISAFNVGVNVGKDAGQSIMHCHVHLIPRRKGDVDDPRGGVRGVIPEKQKYKRK